MAMTGTVRFFNGVRGYGFIKPDDGGSDVFVHISAVERAGLNYLTAGQRIIFDVEPEKEGQRPQGGETGDRISSGFRRCAASARRSGTPE